MQTEEVVLVEGTCNRYGHVDDVLHEIVLIDGQEVCLQYGPLALAVTERQQSLQSFGFCVGGGSNGGGDGGSSSSSDTLLRLIHEFECEGSPRDQIEDDERDAQKQLNDGEQEDDQPMW